MTSYKICTEFIISNTTPILTKPLADLVTYEELIDRGLLPDQIENGYRKVINGLDLDILITSNKDIKDKWVIAPEGWHWKEYKEKCYFNFVWFELEKIT